MDDVGAFRERIVRRGFDCDQCEAGAGRMCTFPFTTATGRPYRSPSSHLARYQAAAAAGAIPPLPYYLQPGYPGPA